MNLIDRVYGGAPPRRRYRNHDLRAWLVATGVRLAVPWGLRAIAALAMLGNRGLQTTVALGLYTLLPLIGYTSWLSESGQPSLGQARSWRWGPTPRPGCGCGSGSTDSVRRCWFRSAGRVRVDPGRGRGQGCSRAACPPHVGPGVDRQRAPSAVLLESPVGWRGLSLADRSRCLPALGLDAFRSGWPPPARQRWWPWRSWGCGRPRRSVLGPAWWVGRARPQLGASLGYDVVAMPLSLHCGGRDGRAWCRHALAAGGGPGPVLPGGVA